MIFRILHPLSNSHTNPNERFQAIASVSQQIFVPLHDATFEQHDNGRSAECKIPELVTTFYLLTFLDGRLDGADHHGPDANRENTPELRAVDWYDLSCVFAVDVQGGSDGLWLEADVNKSAISLDSM